MSCMCGDTHCSSCGPAQGNWRCPICNAWADDGCEHIDEETGDIKPEFVAEAEARAAEEDKAIQKMIEEARLAEEYWRQQEEETHDAE